jgi:hypothetical protein
MNLIILALRANIGTPRVSQSPKTSAQFTCVCFDPDAQYTIMITYTFSRQHAKYYHEFRKQIKACCHKSPMPPFVSSVAVCVNIRASPKAI